MINRHLVRRWSRISFAILSGALVLSAFNNCSSGFESDTAAEDASPSPGPSPGPGPSPNVTAQIAATRISGVAPLAVLFDATASTATGITLPFHELTYAFNFGDDRGLNYSVSNLPKNTQSGAPLAAHVFDNPGTYTVTVRVTNPNTNDHADATINITVTNPDTVFPGTNTVCVSTSNTFTGCPAGATQTNVSPGSFAGKRVLYRRGESFPTITLNGPDDGVLLGAYGTGAKPVIASLWLGGNGNVAAWPDDVIAMDLELTDGFSVGVTGSRILLYRCEMDDPNQEKIAIGAALGYYMSNGMLAATDYYWPREIFLFENSAIGDTNNDSVPHLVVQGHFMKSAFVGNTFNRATEHTIRVFTAHKFVLAHNNVGGEHYDGGNPPGIRAALKLHSGGTGAYNDNAGISTEAMASRQIVSADNRWGSALYNGSWTVGMGPQNNVPGTVEGIEDTIMERDVFTRGTHTSQDIHNVVRRSTVRNQTVVGGLPLWMHQLSVADWSGDNDQIPWIGPYYGMPNNF